ncbi:uncharacterized protein LOC117421018 isoform X1 [Acipenser ruthenus]|uniref:uncharacterized protein LOC117421018 isoform X1 n=1 Tax=Acipenser ruthenus TaxID=7906 RepID=UPI001560683D|nr:uncharacterized protein LOC117421018 isoform X1 [Acipenser ruthenus]
MMLNSRQDVASGPQYQIQPLTARTMKRLDAETVYETDSPRTRNLKDLRVKRLAYLNQGRKPSDPADAGAPPSVSRASFSSPNEVNKVEGPVIKVPHSSEPSEQKADRKKKPAHELTYIEFLNNNSDTVTDGQSPTGRTGGADLDYSLLEDVTVSETEKMRYVLRWAQKYIKPCEEDSGLQTSEVTLQERSQSLFKNSGIEHSGTSSSFWIHESDSNLPIDISTRTSSSFNMVKDSRLEDRCPSPNLWSSGRSLLQSVDLQINEADSEKVNYAGYHERQKWIYQDSLLNGNKSSTYDDSSYKKVSECGYYTGVQEMSCRQVTSPEYADEINQINLIKSSENEVLENILPLASGCSVNKSTHYQEKKYFWCPLQDDSDEEYPYAFANRPTTIAHPSHHTDLDECSEKSSARTLTLKTESVKNWFGSVDVPENQVHKLMDATSRLHLNHYAWETKKGSGTAPMLYASENLKYRNTAEVNREDSDWLLNHAEPVKDLKVNLGSDLQTPKKEDYQMNGGTIETIDKSTGRTFLVNSMGLDKEHCSIMEGKEEKTSYLNCTKDNLLHPSQHNSNYMFRFCPECSSPNDPDINWCVHCGCALIGIIPRLCKEDNSQILNLKVQSMPMKNSDLSKENTYSVESTKTISILESVSSEGSNTNCNTEQGSSLSVYEKYLMYIEHLKGIKNLNGENSSELSKSENVKYDRHTGETVVSQHCDLFAGSDSNERSDAINRSSSSNGKTQFHQQREPRASSELNDCAPDCEQSSCGVLSSVDNILGVEEQDLLTLDHATTEQASELQNTALLESRVFEQDYYTTPPTTSDQTRKTLQELKPKKFKNIQTSLSGHKRYWEKSSIAWSSYTHGQLKPRCTINSRPLSAGQCRKSTNELSLQARPPSAGHPGGNDLKAHFNKRPASAGYSGAQKRRSTNIHNAVDIHNRTTCKNAGTVTRHLNTTQCPEPRKLKNMTRDGEHSMWIFLPDELWIYILSMLSHEDLSHSAQVCQHFRRLANDKTLWEVIRIENSMCLNDNWLSSIGRHCPQSLTLYRCHDEVKSMTDNGLHELFRQCKDSLKELNITSCSGPKLNGDSVLSHASTYCIHLISVDISWTGATDNGIKALVQACRSLQCLSVNGCQMTDDALNSLVKKHGKRLNRLEVFGCRALSAKCMSSMAHECSNMKVLNIGRVPKITDVCATQMMLCFKNLTSLNVTGLNAIRDRVVHHIVRQCPKLESLILSSCPCVTDVSLVEVSTYLPTIRYFDVSGCKKVTDTGVQAIAMTCHHLQYLDLSSTQIGKRGICLLANYCKKNLECVKLSFCKDATEDAVKKMCQNCKRLKLLHLYGCTTIHNVKAIQDVNRKVEVHFDLSISSSYRIKE